MPLAEDEDAARRLLAASSRRWRSGAGDDPERVQRLLLLEYLLEDLPRLTEGLGACAWGQVPGLVEAPHPATTARGPLVASVRMDEGTVLRRAPGRAEAEPGSLHTHHEEGLFRAVGRAGRIASAQRAITVPEKVVRAAHFLDGDRVGLEPAGEMADGSPRFYFRNLSLPADAPTVGYVVPGDGGLAVQAGERLLVLPAAEIDRWKIAPGDVVSVAAHEGGRARIVRMHDTRAALTRPLASPATRPGPSPSPAPPHRRVVTARRPVPSRAHPRVRGRVALIGGHEANRPYYRRTFAEIGLDLDFLPGGTYPRHRVELAVDRSHAVVLLPMCAGHEMIAVARDRARALGTFTLTATTENWSGLQEALRRNVLPRLLTDHHDSASRGILKS